ncbi:MAG: DUF2279 domain-containing protein, partial [Bacteroidota bacterium]
MIRLTFAILFFQFIATVSAQTNSIQETSLKNKKIIYYSSISGIALTSQIGLNELWYKNYPRTNFHFFNDNKEWLQIDKVGHAFSAYQLSQTFFAIHPEKEIHPFKASCIGSTIAFSYLLGIELMDSKSASWGFSSGDILANTSGIFFSFLNQSTRMKNNFHFKFSYTNSSYSNLRPDVFGRNFQQRIFKDYNG